MKLLLLSARELEGLVAMPLASEAMKQAFTALSTGQAVAPPRLHIDVGPHGGKTLLMGAHVPNLGLATKIVSYFPDNRQRNLPAIHGLILVLDPATGVPAALLDGTYLTALRTGAGSCAAIDLLARPDATTGALIGSGGQARFQLLALDTARSLSSIRVFTRTRELGERFVATLQPQVRAKLTLVATAAEAVRGADIIVCSTSSSTPVFSGADLAPGSHVVGIGSITPAMREVDELTLQRARIFVDSLAGVLSEAGELIHAAALGISSPANWTEIGLVAAGRAPGRQSRNDITFYKSVGQAVQDVAIAELALGLARERNLGTPFEL